MGTLKRQRDDVKRQVEAAGRVPMQQRTEQVDGWLQRVEELEREVEELLQQGDEEIRQKCLKICPRNCWSTHKLGKRVSDKLQTVSNMKSEGNFSTVAVPMAAEHAEEIPLDRTVGLDANFHKLLSLLRDDGTGIIGIYGMVLKKINNALASQLCSEFDEVIWVTVSKDLSSVESIQDKIGKKLRFSDEMWRGKSQEEKKADIFKVLKRKRFVHIYISLTVKTELALQKLLYLQKLSSFTFGLHMSKLKGSILLQLSSLQKKMKKLEILEILGCDDIEEMTMDGMRWEERERPHKNNHHQWDIIIDGSKSFDNLREVCIEECKVLKEVTWLIWVPNLQTLRIVACDAMEGVIKDAEEDCSSDELSVFQRLQTLTLLYLPKLKSIYSHPLPFRSLTKIQVYDCPKLNKLPLDCNRSGKGSLQEIECYTEFWRDNLEWENEETRSAFFPLFNFPLRDIFRDIFSDEEEEEEEEEVDVS